jgi:cobalt-zinc-cadmium resistance protein CzcA
MLEVATQVKQVYFELAYLYSKQKLLLHQDSIYSGFLRAAELRAKSGETNKLEMITVRSQRLEVKNHLLEVTADLDISRNKLQILLNSSFSYTPVDSILRRIDFTPVTDSLVISSNPSIAYMQQQVDISRFEKKVEQSQMMPEFSIGYFSQTMQGVQDINGIPRTFGAGDRLTGIQAGVSVPLWFVPPTSKIKAAQIKEKAMQTNAEYYTLTMLGNYREQLSEYSKYSVSLDFYEREALPQAELIIEQATKSYQAGAMDYMDYIMSLNNALEIQQNYLETLNRYNQTIISIDFITGKIY